MAASTLHVRMCCRNVASSLSVCCRRTEAVARVVPAVPHQHVRYYARKRKKADAAFRLKVLETPEVAVSEVDTRADAVNVLKHHVKDILDSSLGPNAPNETQLLEQMLTEAGVPIQNDETDKKAFMRRVNPDNDPDRDRWGEPDVLDADEFDEDDIISMAHLRLEEHREHRHYARLLAWDMPLLMKMTKTYEQPMPHQVLCFRHTSYLGEYHPAEKKVVVTFSPDQIPLEEWQHNKLIKLAGVRYDPEKKIIKISCEAYENAAQNKRRLGELVNRLIASAKDDSDKFEDVPFDFRHHSPTHRPKFPDSWRVNDERMRSIDAQRALAAWLDQHTIDGNTLVGDVKRVNDPPPLLFTQVPYSLLKKASSSSAELQSGGSPPEVAVEQAHEDRRSSQSADEVGDLVYEMAPVHKPTR